MHIIAGMPGLSWILLAITAPTLIALLLPAFQFASTPRQRLANLLTGSAFAVAVIFAVKLGPNSRPNSWADENLPILVIGIAPFGAVFGVIVAVTVRHIAAWWTTPPAR